MTIKEITALRKSGRLPEALEAAETEFSQNANHFTANALFWCLYELLKQQEGEEASANFERMKELYEGFCPGNELMQKTLASGEQRFLPHCQEVKAFSKKRRIRRIRRISSPNSATLLHGLTMEASTPNFIPISAG